MVTNKRLKNQEIILFDCTCLDWPSCKLQEWVAEYSSRNLKDQLPLPLAPSLGPTALQYFGLTRGGVVTKRIVAHRGYSPTIIGGCILFTKKGPVGWRGPSADKVDGGD